MRAHELTEAVKMPTTERLAALLLQNCRLFLSEAGISRQLYRGVNADLPKVGIYKQLGHRRPVNTTPAVSDIADKWFLEATGVKFRSESIFVVGDPTVAHSYGQLYTVAPIGEFKYCWSPLVEDMFMTISDINARNMNDNVEREILRRLNKAQYTTTGLQEAIDSDSEIMLHCSQYYMIDPATYMDAMDILKKQGHT